MSVHIEGMETKKSQRFRRYQLTTRRDGVAPVGYIEYWLGLLAGRILVRTARMANKRGDSVAFNHNMLAIWAGNDNNGGHMVAQLPSDELSTAMRSGQLQMIVKGL